MSGTAAQLPRLRELPAYLTGTARAILTEHLFVAKPVNPARIS